MQSVALKNAARVVAVTAFAGVLAAPFLTNESRIHAQSRSIAGSPNVLLPVESDGLDAVVRTLSAAFDHFDVVALGEAHRRQQDSDLRVALVRSPDFAKNVRTIVVEFSSTTEQATLDRYIRGETVSFAELTQVWKTTTQAPNGLWDFPLYAEVFAAVRDVNSKLPANARIRVLGGDPGPGDNRSREVAAVSVLKEQVLQQHETALVIYGAAHFYRAVPPEYLASMGADIGITRLLDAEYPGRTLAVIPIERLDPAPGIATIDPDYRRFDRALRTELRPVLVSLQQSPFGDFSAEEFLGRTVSTCRGAGGCVSAFKGSSLTLGQIADACVYLGSDGGAPARLTPTR